MAVTDPRRLALGLVALDSSPAHRDAAERHRKELLAVSDRLLGEIEELRLERVNQLPPLLRRRIHRLMADMGRPPVTGMLTMRSAHSLLFSLQQRLMAANPRRPTAASRPVGVPGVRSVSRIRPGLEWKLLTLPGDPGSGREAQWFAAIDATVERAFDRWAYAHHHLLRRVRRGEAAATPLAVARVAWNNYWELLEEACRIRAAREAQEDAT